MLNWGDASQNRTPYSLAAARMCRHETAGAAGGLRGRLELLERERRLVLAVRAPPGIGVHLDPVRAVADLAPHRPDHPVDAVGLLGALRHLPARVESARPVGAGGDDRARDHEQARAKNNPLIDRLF